jgi:D-alanine-D-alanine ligase
LHVLILYNEPTLPREHPDAASEAGVLESVEAVTTALATHVRRCSTLGLSCPEEALASLAELPRYDVIVNLFEGFGSTGRGAAEVVAFLELTGQTFTGSPAACLHLARDKARTKWLLAGVGLPTPEFVLVEPQGPVDRGELAALLEHGPAIVKPAHEDARPGTGESSVVENFDELTSALRLVHQQFGTALVERFIAGRVFDVAILAQPEPQVLPLAEIGFDESLAPADRIMTYTAKWAESSAPHQKTPVRCPAQTCDALAAEIRRVALAAFRRLGCRDYARVDLRVDERQQVYLFEVNANPDIGPAAGFARALDVAGIEYDKFIDRMLKTAYGRRRTA